MPVKSAYKVCPKCKVRHSTLVKHKCFKADKQKDPPKFEAVDHDLEDGGVTESLDRHSGDGQGEGDEGESEGQGKGEGEGEGGDPADGGGESEGQGEGEGEGSGGEAEGEGEEGEGEGPAPQPPEPDAPPVAIVCSVLKFAALTAQCAKNGVITVELTEDGLFVYGYNGDLTASASMPWGEFETRSTIDGQYYVKEVIDGVDAEIGGAEVPMAEKAKRAMAKVKADRAKAPKEEEKQEEAPVALTLPLYVGQKIVTRDGRKTVVNRIEKGQTAYPAGKAYTVIGWYEADTGFFGLSSRKGTRNDAVADAEDDDESVSLAEALAKAKRGHKVTLRDGQELTLTSGLDPDDSIHHAGIVRTKHGWHEADTGRYGGCGGMDSSYDIVAVGDKNPSKKLTR
jgi:hypothetical protein